MGVWYEGWVVGLGGVGKYPDYGEEDEGEERIHVGTRGVYRVCSSASGEHPYVPSWVHMHSSTRCLCRVLCSTARTLYCTMTVGIVSSTVGVRYTWCMYIGIVPYLHTVLQGRVT